MANNNVTNATAFKKMSQRAMWRGDQGQSQMLSNHGMEGLRQNLLRDTPTYQKQAIGFNKGANLAATKISKNATNSTNAAGRNTNANTKVKANINSASQSGAKNLGSGILGALQ